MILTEACQTDPAAQAGLQVGDEERTVANQAIDLKSAPPLHPTRRWFTACVTHVMFCQFREDRDNFSRSPRPKANGKAAV